MSEQPTEQQPNQQQEPPVGEERIEQIQQLANRLSEELASLFVDDSLPEGTYQAEVDFQARFAHILGLGHFNIDPAERIQLEREGKPTKALLEMKKEWCSAQDADKTCTICLENLNTQIEIPSSFELDKGLEKDEWRFKESVVKMSCNHCYHYICILLWLEKDRSCPTCRGKVKSNKQLDDEERVKNLEDLHDSMFG